MPVIEWCTNLSGLGDFKKKTSLLITVHIQNTLYKSLRVWYWKDWSLPSKSLGSEAESPKIQEAAVCCSGTTLSKNMHLAAVVALVIT